MTPGRDEGIQGPRRSAKLSYPHGSSTMKLTASLLLGAVVLVSVLCQGYCAEEDLKVNTTVHTEATKAPTTEHSSVTSSRVTTSITSETTHEGTTKTSEATMTTSHEQTTKTSHEPTTTSTESTIRPTSNETSTVTTGTTTEEKSSTMTTTAPLVTTTPRPTLPPQPDKFTWSVTDHKGVVCILLEAGIRLTFNYLTANDTVVRDFAVDVPASNTTIASGMCGHSSQTIILTFFEDWHLSLTFSMNDTTQYDLSVVSLNYKITPDRFPGAKNETGLTNATHTGVMFVTDEHKKFVCVAVQKIYENTNATNELERIETYSLSFEAFRNSTTATFTDMAKHCEQDEVSQLVPIIVGAALGGLIVIVLIAYLIGRKRSRRGYESV